jgi:hypothetical protein
MANDILPTMAVGGTPAAAPKLRLTHLTGSLTGRTVDLPPGSYRVGRHPDSAVRYDHTIDFLVSTRHGILAVDEGVWTFVDTNSTNGTYVGNARITRHALSRGQTLVLGTPGAPGSASFLVELDPTDAAVPPATADGDGPFAQEPPESQVFVQFTCTFCGATNTASAAQGGQSVPCAACGRSTAVPVTPGIAPRPAVAAPPVVTSPAVNASGAPPVPPPGGGAHAVAAPGGAVPVQGEGFFGGIVSGMKEKINRMRERSELKREVATLEQQVPQMELDARKSCTLLGQELWKRHAAALGAFRSAEALARADDAIHGIEDKIAAAESAYAEEKAAQDRWLADWQAKLTAAEAELAAADADLNATRQMQQQARQAVTAALTEKVAGLSAVQQTLAELISEARGEPRDDFWSRYSGAMQELKDRQAELSAEVPGWADLLAARTAATEGTAAATTRRESADQAVQALKADRASADAAADEARRRHEQAVAGLRAEIEQLKVPLAPYYMDLGRQFVDSPSLASIEPPAAAAAAKSAVERWGLAHATLNLKRQRVNELDA